MSSGVGMGYREMRRYCQEARDLSDLRNYYQTTKDRFLWVALGSHSHSGGPLPTSNVLGCIGLVPYDDDTAEVVRFVVAPASRDQRIGHCLFTTAEECARQHGYRRLILRTNNLLEQALHFYREHDFLLDRVQRRNLLRATCSSTPKSSRNEVKSCEIPISLCYGGCR